VQSKQSGKVVAYSCDTEPADAIRDLAREADILVHEATGEGPGHASAEQAAAIAADANVGRLLLVHLPPGITDDDLHDARTTFAETALGEELGRYTF
jgi:ribonuclease Z